MNLPEIGDIVTIKEALELCRYFGLDYLIERIESDLPVGRQARKV